MKPTSLTLRLALLAVFKAGASDVRGQISDAEEIEALSDYMREVYICPSLTRHTSSVN